MSDNNKLTHALHAAVGGLMTLAASLPTAAAAAEALVQCAEQERCYGVARAGRNDCATATSACAGTTKQDFQKDAWVYVPKGTCAKLAGSVVSATPAPKKK
jgi:uncharacterized membrane protein